MSRKGRTIQTASYCYWSTFWSLHRPEKRWLFYTENIENTQRVCSSNMETLNCVAYLIEWSLLQHNFWWTSKIWTYKIWTYTYVLGLWNINMEKFAIILTLRKNEHHAKNHLRWCKKHQRVKSVYPSEANKILNILLTKIWEENCPISFAIIKTRLIRTLSFW